MNIIAYGIESTIANQEPIQAWPTSKQVREEAIALASWHGMAYAHNQETRYRRIVKLEDGSVISEPGTEDVHVQWRRTRLKAVHRETGEVLNQLALVDVINGHVVVVDEAVPFNPSQVETYSVEPRLDEMYPDWRNERMVAVFLPPLKPASAGAACHYVVADPASNAVLRKQTRSHDYFEGYGPYQIPSFPTGQ